MDRNDLKPADGPIERTEPPRDSDVVPPQRGEPWEREIEAMETQIRLFERGEIPPEKFKEYRLAQGIYGQRQDGVQMIRVKIPNGVLDPEQLEALAEVTENHGHGLAHITTRQDIQFHFVKLGEVPAVLRILASAGLHTREACGNSVRNVTSCPFSGVCREEAFPVLPYAQATARFLLRHAAGQILARKFKIAFSGCESDCASGAIHDIGAIARVRRVDGRLERGFKVLVGGGLGAVPFTAETLSEFFPASDILRLSEALVRVFADHGNRRNRARARMKFIVQNWGIDRFREEFSRSLEKLNSEERDDLAVESYLFPAEIATLHEQLVPLGERPVPLDPPDWPEDTEGSPRENGSTGRNGGLAQDDFPNAEDYAQWIRTNTRAEREVGLRSVTVNFRLGDMRPPDLRGLAAIMRASRTSESRVTIEQNLVLQNVPRDHLPELFGKLLAAGLADARAGTALDVLSCPGADTCNLGITTSKGLAEEIALELDKGGIEEGVLGGTSIKISGCPNSCGQHHVGNIGLHGIARRVNGRQAPFYQLHLGGNIDESGAFIGKGGLKVPARNAPRVVRRLLEVYSDQRQDGETLASFLQAAGQDRAKEWIGNLLELPSPESGPEFYQDFHQESPFSTAELGEGECAGAGTDISSDPFSEAVDRIQMGRTLLDDAQATDVLAEVRRAVYSIATTLLAIGLRKKTNSDYETQCEFQARLVDRGHTGTLWEELLESLDELSARRVVPMAELPELLDLAEGFLLEGRTLLGAIREWTEDPGRAPIPGLVGHGGGGQASS